MSDLTKKEQELLIKRHARAMELRAEFQKQVSNPFRHASGEGGSVFDPALQRFQAMRVTNYDHFRPTPKTIKIGLFTLLIPMVVYGWMLKSERDCREHKYRTGEVAYKDRRFKFI